jgi:hypothetical protein
MRLPRFTTRRLMVLVALLAILMQIARLSATAYHRWQSAYSHELLAHTMRMNGEVIRVTMARRSRQGAAPAAVKQDRAALAQHVEWAEYYSRLSIKYRRAARYPWLLVPPDPPPPE